MSLALVGALAFSPALAQDAAAGGTPDGSARAGGAPPAGAFFLRRGADGEVAMHRVHVDPRARGRRGAFAERLDAAARRMDERAEGERGDRREDVFARWLAADTDAGPVVPGLVGQVAAGTTVRLVFYAGAPEEGGTELGALTFVAGEDDAAAFRQTVRTTAEGATHVVVDVLGRLVSLPEAAPTDAAE